MPLQEKRISKGLGVPGIPAAMERLLDGAIYAAIVDSVPARFSLVIQSIRHNLDSGMICVLLTPTPPGVFLARAEAAGVDFGDALADNRFFLFSQEGDYAKNIFRLGPKKFLDEFDFFKVPRSSFFVIDQADELFTLHDQSVATRQAQEYRDWMKVRGNTALLLFPPENPREGHGYGMLLDYFGGALRIVRNRTEFELLVDFWYSEEGAIAAKAMGVNFDAAGKVSVAAQVESKPAALPSVAAEIEATDQDQGYYVGPGFDGFAAAIGRKMAWTRLESLVSLLHATGSAVAATVVIALDRQADLRQVAETVHYLRLNRGNRILILVRELDFHLRYPNELLLLKLGANLVIHQQVTDQRLALLWESISGQIYARKVASDFEKAYESTVPSAYKGYVDLQTFCREGRDVLERNNFLSITPALVAAAYRPPHSPAEVLGKIRVSRQGDLVTSDETHCYLFLHSCPETNVASTFDRITEGRRDEFFSDVGYILDQDKIREALALIPEEGGVGPSPLSEEAAAEAVLESVLEAALVHLPVKQEAESELKSVMKRLASDAPSEETEPKGNLLFFKSGK